MSLAEYTRLQKKEARVNKRNLEKYLENAEGILTPAEIDNQNKPAIQGFTQAELDTSTKLTKDEALDKATIDLKIKLNEMTSNDEVITNFIISSLDENEIMNLNYVYDEFISSYLLKYGKTPKSKEFFIQSVKNYLLKNYKELKLYDDYQDAFTAKQTQELNKAQQKIADAKADEQARNQASQAEQARIQAEMEQEAQLKQQEEQNKLAEQARIQAEEDQKVYDKRSREVTDMVDEQVQNDAEEIDKQINNEQSSLEKFNESMDNIGKLLTNYNEIVDDAENTKTNNTRKTTVSQEKLDDFFQHMLREDMVNFIQKFDSAVKIPKAKPDRVAWITQNVFYRLPSSIATKFIDDIMKDIKSENPEFVDVKITKVNGVKTRVMAEIDLNEYKKVNKIDIVKLATQNGLTTVDENKLKIISNKIVFIARGDKLNLVDILDKYKQVSYKYLKAYNQMKTAYTTEDVINDETQRGNIQNDEIQLLAKAIIYNNNYLDIQNYFEGYLTTKVDEVNKYINFLLDNQGFVFTYDDIRQFFDDLNSVLPASSASASTPAKSNGQSNSTTNSPVPTLPSTYQQSSPLPGITNPMTSQSTQPSTSGLGLSKKGRVGKSSVYNDIKHPLLYIDKKLLDKNMLSLKYKKNGNSHPKFKTVYISDDLKKAILTNNHSMKLDAREKQILKNLILLIGSDEEKKPFETDNEFNEKFKILIGEFRAGNDSKILKTELKKYILAGLQENKLSRSVALDLMIELNE